MVEKESYAIRNGIIATVVGGLILSSVPALREISIRVLRWLWAWVLNAINKLISTYPIPGWLLLILIIFAMLGAIRVYIVVRPKNKTEQPGFLRYSEDFLYGAKWRWQWVGNQVSNLWCFCPNCDAQLVYDDRSCRNFLEPSKTHFICERCNNQIIATVTGGDKNYAVGAAEREVLRRIRTNEFEKALTNG
jgi:predicted RNA-binding Zn-ribbon protein involved in translation (DUF1610 family)